MSTVAVARKHNKGKCMVRLDITSKENSISTLSDLANINIYEIEKFLQDSNTQLMDFLKEFSLSVKELRNSVNEICWLHFTSNNDENRSVTSNGLRNLIFNLSNPTPLNRFLLNNAIQFDFNQGILKVDNHVFDLENDITKFNPENPLHFIKDRIYNDSGVSGFLFIKDINNYDGDVQYRPEILHDLDNLCIGKQLSQKWIKQCKKYKLKICTPLYYLSGSNGAMITEVENLITCAIEKGRGDLNEEYVYIFPELEIKKEMIIHTEELVKL